MSRKSFRFSLHDVLELRRREAERALRDVAQALQHRRDQEAHVAAAEERLRDVTRRAPTAGSAPPTLLRQLAAHRHEAQRALAAAAAGLAQSRTQEEAARRQLARKRSPEEALKTLRDEERAAHRKALDDAEAFFLDEVAVAAYSRRQRGGAP